MTPEQIAFIEQRRRQIRYWPWLAASLLLSLLAGYVWLWLAEPIHISPLMVLEEFRVRTLTEDELIMMAARGALALIGCGLFVLALVLLISLALWNERRLIRVIDELADATPSSTGTAAPDAGPAPAEAQVPDSRPDPEPSVPDSDG